MNVKKLILSTLTLSVLLSISAKNNIVIGEPSNNLKTNNQKLLKTETNFTYKKTIKHTLNRGRITTRFSSVDSQGYRIDLDTLASQLGYDHFNWVSYVEVDPYGINDHQGNMMSTPYNDPPMGGYQYDSADNLPFYWDVVNCDRCKQRHHIQHPKNLQQFELVFKDAPTDSRLQPGESIEFMTSLVGVKKISSDQQRVEWDKIHTFRWKMTNIAANHKEVSVMDANVNLTELSPSLLGKIILDGGNLNRFYQNIFNL